MSEVWKDIAGFPDYVVSNLGRIKRACKSKNNRAKEGLILKPIENKGYLAVSLYGPQGLRPFLIHRLVLMSFVGPPPLGHESNHKDGNKKNNLLENLEWVTSSENTIHAYRNGLCPYCFGEKNSSAKLNEKDVYSIKGLLSRGDLFQKDIGEMFGVTKSNISCINLGKSWGHVQYP